MPRWKGDKPRTHHYEFAHRAIPGIAFNPRVDLAAIAREDRLDAALRATWAAVGERHDAADRLPDDGLAGELAEVAGQPAVLVTFPVASHAAEAFFALVAPLGPPGGDGRAAERADRRDDGRAGQGDLPQLHRGAGAGHQVGDHLRPVQDRDLPGDVAGNYDSGE